MYSLPGAPLRRRWTPTGTISPTAVTNVPTSPKIGVAAQRPTAAPGSHCRSCFDEGPYDVKKTTLRFAPERDALTPLARRALDDVVVALTMRTKGRLFLCLKCFAPTRPDELFLRRQRNIKAYVESRGLSSDAIVADAYCRDAVDDDRVDLFVVTTPP